MVGTGIMVVLLCVVAVGLSLGWTEPPAEAGIAYESAWSGEPGGIVPAGIAPTWRESTWDVDPVLEGLRSAAARRLGSGMPKRPAEFRGDPIFEPVLGNRSF